MFYLTLNSISPHNCLGWRELAFKIYNDMQATVLIGAQDSKVDLLKYDSSDKIPFKSSDIIGHDDLYGTDDSTLIILEPFSSKLIPKGYNGRIIASICGYNTKSLDIQIKELKHHNVDIILSEYLPEELLSVGIGESLSNIIDSIYFLPCILPVKESLNDKALIIHNERISSLSFGNSSPNISSKIINIILNQIDSTEAISINESENTSLKHIDLYRKLISLINYPQLSFLSYCKDASSHSLHLLTKDSPFSLLRNFIFHDIQIKNKLKIFSNKSIRQSVKLILDNVGNHEDECFDRYDILSAEKIFVFFKQILQKQIDEDHPLKIIKDAFSTNCPNKVNSRLSRKNTGSDICLGSGLSSYTTGLKELLSRELSVNSHLIDCLTTSTINSEVCCNSIALLSEIISSDSDKFIDFLKSNSGSKLIANECFVRIVYYSLLKNHNKDSDFINRIIKFIQQIPNYNSKVFIPRLYMLEGDIDKSLSETNAFMESNPDGIKLLYHTITRELFHPEYRSIATTLLKHTIEYFYKENQEANIKSSLCWAGAMSAVNEFNKGYDIISTLVTDKSLPDFYLNDYLVTSFCFSNDLNLISSKTGNLNLRSNTDSHRLNNLTMHLLTNNFDSANEQFQELINSTKSIYDFKNVSLNKTIPFLIYGRLASNSMIFDLAMQPTNFYSLSDFPDDYLANIQSNNSISPDIFPKIISFLS